MAEQQTDQYFEVFISNLDRRDEDEISGLLFSHGAMGVSENMQFVQPDLRFNPMMKPNKQLQLVGYFPITTHRATLVETIKAHFPASSITVVKADNKDWLEEWKKGWEAFQLYGDMWVVPSWKDVPAAAKTPLFIDPGMAFGTGTHETTQICSHLIADYLKSNKCETAFDIGTGTGILSLVMSKLGVPQITCSDIDPECKRVSLENFQKNGATHITWSEDFSREDGKWDLLVANIIDGVLIDLKSDFREKSGPNTHLILSGILIEREKLFLEEFLSDWPLEIRQRKAMKEWCGFWLAPKGT